MSCESNTRLAGLTGRLTAGINQLSSKQAFYTGLATGAGLTAGLGGGLYGLARYRRSRLWQGKGLLPAKLPVLSASSSGQADGSRRLKKLEIPPKADLPLPKKLKMPAKSTGEIPTLPPASAKSPQTTLEEEAVSVQTNSGPFLTQGYRVLQSDGTATGLAITPQVGQDGAGQSVEKRSAWGVTHLSTGALISGAHPSPEAAQALAGKLAGLRWTQAVVPAADVATARKIVERHHRGAV